MLVDLWDVFTWLAVGLSLGAVLMLLGKLWDFWSSDDAVAVELNSKNPRSGAPGLVGKRAVVTRAFEREADGAMHGRVRVGAERWKARLEVPYDRVPEEGEEVEVTAVDGVTLFVLPPLPPGMEELYPPSRFQPPDA